MVRAQPCMANTSCVWCQKKEDKLNFVTMYTFLDKSLHFSEKLTWFMGFLFSGTHCTTDWTSKLPHRFYEGLGLNTPRFTTRLAFWQTEIKGDNVKMYGRHGNLSEQTGVTLLLIDRWSDIRIHIPWFNGQYSVVSFINLSLMKLILTWIYFVWLNKNAKFPCQLCQRFP